MGNNWKGIATQLVNRSGNQTKNQFFNLIRVLLRKAFKVCFEQKEQIAIANIRPSFLSNLIRMPLSQFKPYQSTNLNITVRQFLKNVSEDKLDDEWSLADAQKTMISIKTWLLAKRLIKEYAC